MIEALNFGGADKPWPLTQWRFYWPGLGR